MTPPAFSVSAEIDDAAWNAYVDRTTHATAYHMAGWRGVFERAFGHRTVYLAARRGGVIVGVLPLVELRSRLFGRFLVSLPFVNYGGVLADDSQTATALLDRATAIAAERRLSHVELRHRARQYPHLPCKNHKVTMLLPLLPDHVVMWNHLDRKVRNQVRKAEKNGLICEIGGPERLDEFYPVFAANMRDLGTPVYAKRFFMEVLAAFRDRMSVFVVRGPQDGRGRPIAAGIGLSHRGIFEVPWASSLKTYRSLCPNNLLYWRAITHAIDNRCHTFDFGRSTPNEGTFHFKAQWGARAEPLCWEYSLLGGTAMPDQSPANPKFALAIRLWKRLPVAVAGLIGPRIVRSIP